MITRFNKFNLITENPDTVYYHNSEFCVSDNDAIGFICDISSDFKEIIKIFITEPGNYHSNLGSRKLPDGTRESSTNLGYKGRLWSDAKIISFWVYPNPVLFKKIIKLLEEKTDLKIFNNGWKIEVVTNDSGDFRIDKEDNEEEDAMYYSNRKQYDTKDFIPVEEYVGSDDVSEEDMATHLLSWQEKEKRKKEKGVKGFGSAKTAWDKPHNIKWRQALHQENKKN
jgi:hypothetical protein